MSIKFHHTITVITVSLHQCLSNHFLATVHSVIIKLLSNYCTVWWCFIDMYCTCVYSIVYSLIHVCVYCIVTQQMKQI